MRTIISIGVMLCALPAFSWGADATGQEWHGIAIAQPERGQAVDGGASHQIQFGQINSLPSSGKAGATWGSRTLPEGLISNGQNVNSEAVLSRPLPPGSQEGAVMENGIGNGVGKLFENHRK